MAIGCFCLEANARLLFGTLGFFIIFHTLGTCAALLNPFGMSAFNFLDNVPLGMIQKDRHITLERYLADRALIGWHRVLSSL